MPPRKIPPAGATKITRKLDDVFKIIIIIQSMRVILFIDKKS